MGVLALPAAAAAHPLHPEACPIPAVGETGWWHLGDFPHPWCDAQETISQSVVRGLKGAKISVVRVGRGLGQQEASGG